MTDQQDTLDPRVEPFARFMQGRDARTFEVQDTNGDFQTWDGIGELGREEYLKDAAAYVRALDVIERLEAITDLAAGSEGSGEDARRGGERSSRPGEQLGTEHQPSSPIRQPADSGAVPANWEQIKELAVVIAAAAGFGTDVTVDDFAQAEAVLKHEVEVEGSFFTLADMPDILGRHMRALDDAGRREKQHWIDQHEQPSPHPPTRGQVDTAVGAVLFNVSNYPKAAQSRLWGRNIGPLREKVTDAVFALLSQPTPTAEPACGVPSPHDAHRVDPAPGDDFFDCAGTTTYWHDPEPPLIEDMAPGTTFTASYGRDLSATTRWMRCTGPSRCVNVGGVRFNADAIDPSTIRDVTPPSGGADGG